MPTLLRQCPSCHQPLMAAVGQSVYGQRLVWSEGRHCTCGYIVEIDGSDEWIDPKVRQAIIDEEGRYGLSIHNTPKSRTSAIKVLRSIFDLPLQLVKHIDTTTTHLFLQGTRQEMHWIQNLVGPGEATVTQIHQEESLLMLSVTDAGCYTITRKETDI